MEHLFQEGNLTQPLAAFGVKDEWFFTYSQVAGAGAPWPLLLSAGSALAYLILVYVIAPQLRPRSSDAVSRFKLFKYYHNVALFFFSLISCTSTFYFMWTDSQFSSLQRTTCDNAAPYWLVYLNLAFVLSKVWEWIDTVMLVWSAKDFSKLNFLHVYHHATTFWLFLLVANFPGCIKMGLLLNGFVHTLMYAHYAWPFPKAIVPFITMAQIVQLFFVTYMWTVTPTICGGDYAVFAFRSQPLEFLTPYIFVPVYIIFFLRFFFKRFVLGQKPRPRLPRKVE
jgi:hypothetical protein